MALLRIAGLPADALAAAADFHARLLPQARELLNTGADDLTLVFAPADHSHRGWRLAAVQGLAREHAPLRVNALAARGEAEVAAALDWLARAPGVTGQYLPLDGAGAGAVLLSAA